MNINHPGISTGLILGIMCLFAGVILRIWAPEFSGFFDRGHESQPVPVYAILLILAAINFGYAILSKKISKHENR